jgi:two-component system, NtrC family, response regulator PilR
VHIVLLRAAAQDSLEHALAERGHRVANIRPQLAIEDATRAELTAADLIVADVEDAERADLVGKLGLAAPGIEVVLVGPTRGAPHPDVFAHLDRPLDPDRLLELVNELAHIVDGHARSGPVDLVSYDTLFAGDSARIRDLQRRVRLVARSEAPAWVIGDDGSGRGIVARAIHDRSGRRPHPFLAFNTSAHADEELSRLLFQGEGAAVESARGGTIFIERLGAAGPHTQRELVHYLEMRQKDARSPRIIVGVESALADGAQQPLSSELYFRLKVLEVEIPALKDRGRDIEQIVSRMLDRLAPGTKPRLTPDAMRLLERYTFPGNLLELAHALTHAFVLAAGNLIQATHLPLSIRRAAANGDGMLASPAELEALDIVAKRFEREYLLQVLRNVDGNRGRAAEILGLSRKGLWGKLKAHGISDDDIDPDEP